MHAMCPSDVNLQGHLRNNIVPSLVFINTHLTAVIISSSTPSPRTKTLAPTLARVDAGEKALSCRHFFDDVLMPATDLVFSAAVGVFRRQVRARKIELLGLSIFDLV